MDFVYRRRYAGRLQGVVVDWAGTIVDYGSCAPVVAISRAYRLFDVAVEAHEVRRFMGRDKREHVRRVGETPRVRELWRSVHGADFSPDDATAVYNRFVEIDAEIVAEHSVAIPGALEAFAAFRERGLKIGTTTGYTRTVMDRVEAEATRQGLVADCVMAASDVSAGRPAPWMMFTIAERLGFYPMEAVVKIGDNPVDVEEGLNAGCWTIGLAQTGNLLGLSREECEALDPQELEARLAPVRTALWESGAHYVVDSISDCLPLLDHIEARLAAGERP